MPTSLASICAVLALSATAVGAAAEPPECSRVVPGLSFPRVEIVDQDTVQAWAPIGDSGEDGLVFVRRRPSPSLPAPRFYLQSAVPDGQGAMALGEIVDLHDPDPFVSVRTVLTGDFDGDGTSDGMVYWAHESRGRIVLDFLKGLGGGAYDRPVRRFLVPGGHVADPVAGDYDGDGKLEVAAYLRGSMTILGIEGGGFAAEPVQPAGTFLGSRVVDWNADGYDDIAFHFPTDEIGFLLGAPQGALTTLEVVSVPYTVIGITTLNGKLLAIEGDRIGLWFFTFEAVHQLEREAPEAWVIDLPDKAGRLRPSIDLDGDGLEELMFGERPHPFFGVTAGFEVHWGQPHGAPTPGPKASSRSYPVASVDVNDDGVRDLITNEFGIVLQPAPRLIDEGMVTTRASMEDRFVDEPFLQVEIGDLDEDGLDDVLFHAKFPFMLATALSRGDGTFDVTPLPISPARHDDVRLRDLDGDGHLDLLVERGARSVGWGVGDGSFDPYDIGEPASLFSTRRYGRLDDDRWLDRVEIQCDSFDCAPYALRTALGAERVWHETPFVLELPPDRFAHWNLVDLDNDGLDDFVMSRRLDLRDGSSRLVWRRALGDGSFGEETPVVDTVFPRPITRIVPTDFDLDGVTDLFLAPFCCLTDLVSLRGDGRGGFEVVWSGPRSSLRFGDDDRLGDVDGDGRPDLVSGQHSGWGYPLYRVQIRRGDGLGGFHPVEPTVWAGTAGLPGLFRPNGTRDLVRLVDYHGFRINLELFPSLGRVLPRDVAPPTVEIGFTPAAEEGHWRVTTVPLDECDDRPRIVRRVVEMLPVRPHPAPEFRRAERFEIRVYEVPSRARRDVLLLGPGEAEARETYAAALTLGGVPFESFGVLELGIDDEHGDERGPTIRAARLAQRFVLEDRRLVAAFASHPTADLFLAVDAEDRSGKLGTTRLSVKEAIATGERAATP